MIMFLQLFLINASDAPLGGDVNYDSQPVQTESFEQRLDRISLALSKIEQSLRDIADQLNIIKEKLEEIGRLLADLQQRLFPKIETPIPQNKPKVFTGLISPNGFPIAAGEDCSFVVTDGKLWTFGQNQRYYSYYIPDSSKNSVQYPFIKFQKPQELESCLRSKMKVFGIADEPSDSISKKNIEMIASGDFHCLFVAGGELYSFGCNDDGRLGRELTSTRPECILKSLFFK